MLPLQQFCMALSGFLPGPWKSYVLQLTHISVKKGLSRQLVDLLQIIIDLYPDAHEILGNDVLLAVRSALEYAGSNKGS